VVPVCDRFVPQHLIRRLDVAGRHVTKEMIKLLMLRGNAFISSADFHTVRQIRVKRCYVAYDINVERKLPTCLWRTALYPMDEWLIVLFLFRIL
jgi:actin-related protein 2